MALLDISTLGAQPTSARGAGTTTLGKAHLHFARQTYVDEFAEKLAAFERGELGPDDWRAFRLVNGAYGQRQDGDLSMLRVKIPQGVLSRPQLDALADVAQNFARGWAHVTTRQNIQYHFLKLGEVEEVMRRLAETGLTCREACGNAVRSITGSPTAGIAADEAFDVTPYGVALTDYFLGHPLARTLPRKFKIAFTGGGADHCFASVNDIGWHAAIVDGKRAFKVTVAGGTATFLSAGKVLFEALPAGQIFGVAEAILRVFHRDGNRVNRAKNRMKYLIKELGWDEWKRRFDETYALVQSEGVAPLPFDAEDAPAWASAPTSRALAPTLTELRTLIAGDENRGPGLAPRLLPTDSAYDRWHRTNVRPQAQPGFAIVTLALPLGDIAAGRLRALGWLAAAYGDGTVRLTADQNVLLTWVPGDRLPELFAALNALGLGHTDPLSAADVVSCPGAESCKLAVTQSRGVGQLVSDHFADKRALLDEVGELSVRASGCPNGCSLHHVAGIGLQGSVRKVAGKVAPQYFLLLGGDASVGGVARFGKLAAKVPARRVPQAIEALLRLYLEQRETGEAAAAFFARVDGKLVKTRLAEYEKLDEASATDQDFIDLGEQRAFVVETSEGECAT